ncbi:alanine racemase [Paraglaciecola sp.]|uniref:alanine racemase n=1 Tax=Paraglaciecola sp. TaxID=1920173 RepID=UPI003262DDB0
MQLPTLVSNLPTPCLLLDINKLEANIKHLSEHIGALGGSLRPHVKTHKSIDVMRKVIEGGNTEGITVSTLKEADYFFENGVTDILYAVSISPDKLSHVQHLMMAGCDLKIILDNIDVAKLVASYGERNGICFKVLIELDTDNHRSGVDPEGDELIEIAAIIDGSKGTSMLGVMTHAGESYHCNTPESLLEISHLERDRSVLAADRLKDVKLPCPVVSIGSTPTALSIDDLKGITEVRAGVYTFFDLVMAGVGVCQHKDIALSVLASVIGFQHAKGWIITDGGWMALSRDRGTSGQTIDYGYGLVSTIDGHAVNNLIVRQANQEHGILSNLTTVNSVRPATLNIGSHVQVLPNHACSTASQYSKYYVVDGDHVIAEWDRINGW